MAVMQARDDRGRFIKEPRQVEPTHNDQFWQTVSVWAGLAIIAGVVSFIVGYARLF